MKGIGMAEKKQKTKKIEENESKIAIPVSMEKTDKLPKGEFMIGAREIAKAVKQGSVKKVFIASNCPSNLLEKISDADIIKFSGDQRELAARLGKSFPIAMAGLVKDVE